jgi:hypothetical protein
MNHKATLGYFALKESWVLNDDGETLQSGYETSCPKTLVIIESMPVTSSLVTSQHDVHLSNFWRRCKIESSDPPEFFFYTISLFGIIQ